MIHKSDIIKNKKYWENMNDFELREFRNLIYRYYAQEGFPYYPTDENYRNNEFKKLLKYDYSNLIEDGIVKQTMHGLGLAWSYFPHSFDVKCNDKMTPLEVFNNDQHFIRVIEKRLKMGTFISDAGIRKMLKMYSNTQAVSNFRPTAAAAIYDKYAPNGDVWDMSGGWGGRMLGAMISSVKSYTCTEPSLETYYGLCKLKNDYDNNTKIDVSIMGSELYIPMHGTFDLCFTSPPYFDLEKYCDHESQSYVKYPNIDQWIDGFLTKTFKNCHYGLKKGGHMIINIADSKKSKYSLEHETLKAAIKIGFLHVETLKLALSNPNMKNRTSAFKYEPIFVFKKIW